MNAGYIILIIVVLNAMLALARSIASRGIQFDLYNLSLLAVCLGGVGTQIVSPRWGGFAALTLWLFLVALPEVLRHRRRSVVIDEKTGDVIPQSARSSRHSQPASPITKIIIVLNVIGFAIEFFVGALQDKTLLFELGAAYAPAIRNGDWWRLLTAQYLHFDILHLGCNMIGLMALGPFVEAVLGKIRVFALYTICGACGMLAVTMLGSIGMTNPDSLLIGASAGVLGLVGITGGIFARLHFSGRSAVAAKQLKAIGQILALQMVFDFMVPQVSSTAHLGGAITGFLLGLIQKPRFRVVVVDEGVDPPR